MPLGNNHLLKLKYCCPEQCNQTPPGHMELHRISGEVLSLDMHVHFCCKDHFLVSSGVQLTYNLPHPEPMAAVHGTTSTFPHSVPVHTHRKGTSPRSTCRRSWRLTAISPEAESSDLEDHPAPWNCLFVMNLTNRTKYDVRLVVLLMLKVTKQINSCPFPMFLSVLWLLLGRSHLTLLLSAECILVCSFQLKFLCWKGLKHLWGITKVPILKPNLYS